MQYTVVINQVQALDWGLNAQQAMLFAFVYECPSWCRPVIKGEEVYFALSKAKIIEELPLLTDKPDTAYRLLRNLQEKGLIDLSHTPKITLVRLTEKAQAWNRNTDEVGKKSEVGRKKIRGTSEKNPTNQLNHNQGTNNQNPSHGACGADDQSADEAKGKSGYPEAFEQAWAEYPARDGSNPKREAYQAWAARLKAGATAEAMLEGVRRYSAYCRAKGSLATSYVMQARRFFGPSCEFESAWTPLHTSSRQPGRLGMAEPQAMSAYSDDHDELPLWQAGA